MSIGESVFDAMERDYRVATTAWRGVAESVRIVIVPAFEQVTEAFRQAAEALEPILQWAVVWRMVADQGEGLGYREIEKEAP